MRQLLVFEGERRKVFSPLFIARYLVFSFKGRCRWENLPLLFSVKRRRWRRVEQYTPGEQQVFYWLEFLFCFGMTHTQTEGREDEKNVYEKYSRCRCTTFQVKWIAVYMKETWERSLSGSDNRLKRTEGRSYTPGPRQESRWCQKERFQVMLDWRSRTSLKTQPAQQTSGTRQDLKRDLKKERSLLWCSFYFYFFFFLFFFTCSPSSITWLPPIILAFWEEGWCLCLCLCSHCYLWNKDGDSDVEIMIMASLSLSSLFHTWRLYQEGKESPKTWASSSVRREGLDEEFGFLPLSLKNQCIRSWWELRLAADKRHDLVCF